MNKDLLIKHIRWLLKEYDRQFRLARKGAKEEPVHDLRVMMKRLSALFLFLNEGRIYKNKSKAFFNQLREFFKTAGNLRDLQVMKSLVDSYRNSFSEDIKEYDTFLFKKELHAKDTFYKKADEYPKLKQVQVRKEIIEAISKFSDESLSQKSFAFMVKRLNSIDEYLISADTEKYLHKIRQTLKQLRFFIEIFHASSQLSIIEESDFNEIKEIENIIGGWNDRSILIEDIRRYILYNQKLGCRLTDSPLTRLQEMIRNDRRQMVKDIKPRLLKFIYHLKYSIL